MTQKMREIVERMLSDKAKRRWRRGARSVVGLVVALSTLYSLILPALTFAKDTVCGMEEHTHDASCYTTETVPGEMELACDKASIGVHVHTEDCYDANHKTVCGYADYVVHTHTDACYADGVLVCPLDELKAHTHTDGCYTEVTTLTCEQEEAEGVHTHTEECYTTTRELTCLKPEIILHTHTDDCFETLEDGTKILACTQTEVREHIHGENCFREKQVQVLTCGMEEHTHTDDCYDTETTPPTQETTAPTEETTAPTEETTAPTEATTASTEETTAPTEETTVPTEETTAPTESTTAPTEDTTVPAEESNVPAKGVTTPTEKVTLGITKTNAIAPMSTDTVVASGTTGDLTWKITGESDSYTLTISGTGDMPDYDYNGMPWYSYRSSIKTVVIEDGVTTVGDYAFYKCNSLTTVMISDGVTSIGYCAFNSCSSLVSVDLPTGWITIWQRAFYGCNELSPLGELPRGTYYVDSSDAVYGKVETTAYVAYCPAGVEPAAEIPNEAGNGTYAVTDLVAKGVSGDITWELTSESGSHTLRISGVGAMPDYSYKGMPWYSYRGSIKTVVIEDGVTSIGSYAFCDYSSLTSVTVPDSVTSIGNYAIAGCSSLTSVTIPEGVTSISDHAFSSCSSLTSVTIPDRVTSIGDSAFNSCSSLISVTIPEGVTSIGSYAFAWCSSLASVVIPEGVASIGGDVFRNCSSLTSVEIGRGVTSISGYAFANCGSLTSIKLNAKALSIVDSKAFYGECNIQQIVVDEGVDTLYPALFSLVKTETKNVSQVSFVGSNYFSLDSTFTDTSLLGDIGSKLKIEYSYYADEDGALYLVMSGGAHCIYSPDASYTPLTTIPAEGFDGSVYTVRSAKQPVAVGYVNDLAWIVYNDDDGYELAIIGAGTIPNYSSSSRAPWYSYRSGIKTAVIEDGVTRIGNYAFYYCSSLTAVTIQESVTSIGEYAFNNCSSLASVDLPTGWGSIDRAAFTGCTGLGTLSELEPGYYYIDGNDVIYKKAETTAYVCNCPSGVEPAAQIPNEDGSGFYAVTDLVAEGVDGDITWAVTSTKGNITLTISGTGVMSGDGYKNAPWYMYCDIIDTVVIEEGVTRIGNCAFQSCRSLTLVTIPDSVTGIGNYAFDGCSKLASVTIPNSVTSIGSYAFRNCSSLTSVTIPDRVTSIGNNAFDGCSKLASVTIPGSVTSIGGSVFEDCSSLISVTIPEGVTSIGSSAFSGCSSLTSVTIGNSVTSIGGYAFYNCWRLSSVDLPAGWIEYGNKVFYGCRNLAMLSKLNNGYYHADSNAVIYAAVDSSNACVVFCPEGVTPAEQVPNVDNTGFYKVQPGLLYVVGGRTGDLFWSITGDTDNYTLTIAGAGAMPNYGYKSMPWYSYCSNINTVVIEDGITSIGSNAFQDCRNLTSVTIPGGVTSIGSEAFYICSSLTTVTIPDSVTSIGSEAFAYCRSLTTVTIPDSVTSIGDYAFDYCSGLTSVEIGEGVTNIGGFSNCSSLTSITLNAKALPNVYSLDFANDKNIRQVTVGTGVDTLYPGLFSAVKSAVGSAPEVSFAGPNYFTLDSTFTDTSLLGKVGDRMGAGQTYFMDEDGAVYLIAGGEAYYIYSPSSQYVPPVTIPTEKNDGSVYKVYSTQIPVAAGNSGDLAWSLYKSSGVYRLIIVGTGTIPDYITTNAPWYSYCENIASVHLGEGISGIGAYAFQNCSRLSEVEIPASVMAVDPLAFKGCTSLYSISVADGSTSYKGVRGILYDADLTTMVYFPQGKNSVYAIPETVTAIGRFAFGYNDILTCVDIPSSVVTIAEGAFYECDSLQELALPETLTTIGDYAFYSCDSLTSVDIPGSVTGIGASAFQDCKNLTQINAQGGYITLGADAFTDTACYANQKFSGSCLHYMDAEGGLYWINDGKAYYIGCPKSAMDYCALSKTPRIGELGPYWVDNEANFLDYGATGELYWYIVEEFGEQVLVIDGEGTMPDYTSSSMPWYNYRSSLSEVIIEDSVTNVGSNAFNNFSSLKTVRLPSGWISIGSDAFYGNSSDVPLCMLHNGECYVDAYGVIYTLGAENEAYVVYRPLSVTDILAAIPDQAGNADVYPVMADIWYVVGGQIGNIWWTITEKDGKRTLTIGGNGDLDSYSYPGNVPWYDYRVSIETVIIEDGITNICNKAFYQCSSLTSVTIPEGITSIGSDAFYNCSNLTSVTIPNSVYDIGYSAFENCSSLTTVTIPNRTHIIGSDVFRGCSSLTTVDIGGKVEYIGHGAFENCSALTSLTIRSREIEISKYAFANCSSLTSICFPDTSEAWIALEDDAFYRCTKLSTDLRGLKQGDYCVDGNGVFYQVQQDDRAHILYIPEGVTTFPAVIHSKDWKITYSIVEGYYVDGGTVGSTWWSVTDVHGVQKLTIGGYGNMPSYSNNGMPWYSYCSTLRELIVKESIYSIGSNVCYECGKLEKVCVTSPVSSIDYGAFYNCNSLTKVDLPAGWVNISSGAFSGCTKLAAAMKELVSGNYYFDGNGIVYGKMKSTAYVIYCPEESAPLTKIPNEDNTVFYPVVDRIIGSGTDGNIVWTIADIDGIRTLTISGDGTMPNYSSNSSVPWYNYCAGIYAVVIEDGITSVGDRAFINCSALSSVTLPKGISGIGNYAFTACSKLTSVAIPEGVRSIGSNAFQYCSSLTSVTIPEGVTGIGDSAFSICNSLTSVEIGKGVTSIGNDAFYYCSSLTSVIIPDGVISIGSSAFSGCRSLTSVSIPEGVTGIGTQAFSDCSSLTTVTIPESVTGIGTQAFSGCSSLTAVTFPDSITSIGKMAFAKCTSLAKADLPDGWISIGSDAFSECTSLATWMRKLPSGSVYIDCEGVVYCRADVKVYYVFHCPQGSVPLSQIPNKSNTEYYPVIDWNDGTDGDISWTITNGADGRQLLTVSGSGGIPNYISAPWSDYFDSIQIVQIEEGITSIGGYAFEYCGRLTDITLNAKALVSVDSSAFLGDINIRYVTVGTGVDTLYPALFKEIKAKTGGIPRVNFLGSNFFTVGSTFTDTSLLGNLGSYLEPGGAYYLDEYGALYAIEDAEAALLYVPAGITEYTIPGQLPVEDGSDPLPVTAVYGDALSQAVQLEKLTFERPETIVRLADFALANCPTLTQVNGENTVAGANATFTNENMKMGSFVFINTGLSDGTPLTQEVIEITAGGGSKLQLLTHPDARDGDYTFYTGEAGRTTIAVNGGNDGFRVYFAFSSPQGAFSMGEGDHKFVSDKTGEIYTVKVEKLVETNVYCLNIPAVAPSDTISFDVTYKYLSPSSSGGTVTIWGEAVTADQTEPAVQESDEYHSVSWITEPETYTASKRLSGNAKLYGDGTEDGYLSVVGLMYTITLTPDNQRTAPEGLGVDPVTGVDYSDILTLPEGMIWKQEILDAVAGGSWSSKTYYDDRDRPAGTELCYIIDDLDIVICRINSTSITGITLSLTDDGEPCIGWQYVCPSTGLQNQSYTIEIMNGCLLGKRPSVTELDDSYTLTNTVTAVEHFKYSADQTDTAVTTDTIVPTEATLTLNKTDGDETDEYTTTCYGAYFPYTITMSNYGSRHLRYINTVTDVLLTDLYITPADMIQMLRSDQGGENLTITIKNATLYQQLPKSTVTGTNGREYSPTIQNTSLNTEYVDKRLTPEDDSVFVSDGNATLTLGWVDGVLTLQADVSNDASMPKLPFTSKQVEDAASLQTALEQLGYYVTPGVQYTVCWNYKNELPLWSGETRTYQVRSTVKDAFMSIGFDKNWYRIEWWKTNSLGKNMVAVEYTINGEGKTASAATPIRKRANDFFVNTDVYKDGEPVDERTIMEGGGVADFYVSFSHSGTASYDVVPLVDRMRGAEILMVRATENPHLGTEYGLTPRSIGGLDYYLLDEPGTYENVMVGGYLAESVTVSPYDADRVDPEIFKGDYGALDISSCNPDGLDTMIRWYFTDISGSVSHTLKFKVLMAPVGDYASSIIFGADNQVWLNDHQTHRLWSGVGIFASCLDYSKGIALEHMEGTNRRDVLDEDGYTRLYEGDTVTYRLCLQGFLNEASVQAGRKLVVPGSIIYDALPKSTDGYRWSTANVTGIEYVISDEENVEVVNRDHWQIVDIKPGTLTDTDPDQQYLNWDDDFCITFHTTGAVYMYITLQFPEGDDWERYADAYGAERLENVCHFGVDVRTVHHDLAVEGTATLVKGVNSTGVYNGSYYPSGENGSRYFYVNDDSQRRVVTYYVALYNEGRTRLYLDDIQDSLPEGFTLCSVLGTGSGNANVADVNGGGVKYMSAVINVTEKDGKLHFRASDGDLSYDSYYKKYYLLPHEALVFSYRCYTNDKEKTADISENTVAMAYFDYNTAGMKLGNSQITGSGNLTRKNDGTCRLLDNGTAGKYGFTTDFADASTQWLSSVVVVQRGEIIPGISKRVSKVTEPLDRNNTGLTNFASYNDSITWKITARNDGTAPIRDYVLTDVMQTDYVFNSEVRYAIHFGDRFGNPSALDKSEVLFEISQIPENGSRAIVTETFGTLVVSRSETDQGPSLTIRFKDDKAAIPEGGYGVLEVTTRSGDTHRNTTYTNTSYITPSQTWEESQVNVGDVVEFNGKKSVQASALITVAASYMTTSVKRVEEKGKPDNFATSDSSRNAIVIPDGEKPFTYTLSVTNTASLNNQTMDRLVIIDSLPGLDDHNVLLDTDLRFSQFQVDLAETPNFTVTIVDKDGNETPLLPGTDYRLEFSDKTSFAAKDWDYNLENEESSEADRDWYTTPGPNTRSFRVVITEAEHNRLIAAKATVTVSFDARIHPEDLTNGEALPGETAWNSFGYQYGLTGSTIVLSAAPLKVGVKLPSVPVLVKRIQTPEGSAFPTEQDETFRYVIYKQSGTDVLDLDGLTEDQIGEALTQANVKFTCVELTVASGKTESEMRMLKDQNRWNYTDGQWTEDTEEPWDWEDGASYIFYELPIKNAEDYAFGSLGGVRRNSFRYVHDAYNKYTVISVNVRRVWNISLLKVADNDKQSVLAGAWFGLYSPNAEDRYTGQIPEGLTEAVPESLEYGEKTYYLADIRQSGADGTILWKDLEELRYVLRELQPPAGYHYNEELYLLERPEEVYFNTVDITVKNRSGYEMPESGGIGTGLYTTMGMILTLTAGAALIVCRRRKKREET